MPGKRYVKPVSKRQAQFFGFAAGGGVPGFKPSEARHKLKGVKMSKLPSRVKRRK